MIYWANQHANKSIFTHLLWVKTLALLVVFMVPHASAQAPLRSLTAAEVTNLLGDKTKPYAFVTRPSDRDYTRVDILTIDPKTKLPLTRTPTELGCARVHAASDGNVYCFTRVIQGKPKYYTGSAGYLFDRNLKQIGAQAERRGMVSRARISKDGKHFSSSAFTTGHSYLGVGGTSFSTAAFLGKATTPRYPDNLQDWQIMSSGKQVGAIDLNLWGVTFSPTDSDRFLVTVYFDGKPNLGEGSIAAKRITVLRGGVECPSYSPNGARIAFKKRVSITQWIPAVLELATGKETHFPMAESVDDQIEWLDGDTLIFELSDAPLIGAAQVDLYTLDIKQPRPKPILWLADARSPTFVRP